MQIKAFSTGLIKGDTVIKHFIFEKRAYILIQVQEIM